jgi:heme-degrading monooxygenase HmoA
MYIAMNHFRVRSDATEGFEEAWRKRESHLAGVPGFRRFHLLRGDAEADGNVGYASHTEWEDEASFQAWTKSEAFARAHSGARTTAAFLVGPPRFVGWRSVPM